METATRGIEVASKAARPSVPEEWTREFPKVTRWEIRRKAKMHDDTNPIHHDDAAARAHKMKFKAIVGCVMQLQGYIAASISRTIPNVVARQLGPVDVKNPLYPGAIPRVHCKLEAKMGMAFVTATIKDGERIIAVGKYVLVLP